MSPVHTKNRGWKQTSRSEISTLPSEFISEENTSTNVWPITQHAAQSSAPEGKALLGSSVARLRLRRFLKYSIFILWTLHPVRLASSSAFPGIRWDTDLVQMFAFNKDLLNHNMLLVFRSFYRRSGSFQFKMCLNTYFVFGLYWKVPFKPISELAFSSKHHKLKEATVPHHRYGQTSAGFSQNQCFFFHFLPCKRLNEISLKDGSYFQLKFNRSRDFLYLADHCGKKKKKKRKNQPISALLALTSCIAGASPGPVALCTSYSRQPPLPHTSAASPQNAQEFDSLCLA